MSAQRHAVTWIGRCKAFGCPHADDGPAYCCAHGGHWKCEAGKPCRENQGAQDR